MSPFEKKLLEMIRDNPDVSPSELVVLSGCSRSAVHAGLRKLLETGFIKKRGTSPQVYYSATENISATVQDSFVYKDPAAGLMFGMDGFRRWSDGRFGTITLSDKIHLYEENFTKYQQSKEKGLFFTMDASLKIPSADITFDSLRCFDLYTLQIDKETKRSKEAVLLEVVKGSGNPERMKALIHEYIESSVKNINTIIEKDAINAVAFVPPTATRKVQVMQLLKKSFAAHNYHKIDIVPIRRDFSGSNLLRLEQKQIASVENRIINARNTYKVVRSGKVYKKLLLVDDLVGSGATVNEIARKCKENALAEEVHCLCLVGINTKNLVVVRKL